MKRFIPSLLIFVLGCGGDDFVLDSNIIEFEPRVSSLFSTNNVFISDMTSNDVLVAVNGYPLRKYAYENLMSLKLQSLQSQKKMDAMTLRNKMDVYRKDYMRHFVAQRLLTDEAFRLGVVSTNEVVQAVAEKIRMAARKTGKTPEAVLSSYGKDKKYFLYEFSISYVIDKLIHDKIPPLAVVDDAFIDAVQKQVADDNAAAHKTNQLYAARLKDYRKQMLSGKIDFRTVAARISMESIDSDDAGVWGEFAEDDIDDPKIRHVSFSLPLNGISDVIEDDNGFHLIKVLSITPAETNAEGCVVGSERRKLSDIFIEKMPIMLTQSNIAMGRDLKQQMQMQAVNRFVSTLYTNGQNRIEYPCGKNIFR